MQEQRQNWHRFQKILGFLPSKKQGLAVLIGDKKVLSGAVSAPNRRDALHFQDAGLNFEHVESLHELLSHKYNAGSMSFIDRNELLGFLGQLTSSKKSPSDSYYTQLQQIRAAIGVGEGEKTKLSSHLGDKPIQDFWPRENFLLRLFTAMFVELLPERKILLFGLIRSEHERELLALEFVGANLKAIHHPDTSHLEWTSGNCDFFHRDTANRLVLWCENHYMLPSYAIFFSETVWQECCNLQVQQNERAAWRHFLKIKQSRDAEREVLVEPEPWPLKACLHWNGMR